MLPALVSLSLVEALGLQGVQECRLLGGQRRPEVDTRACRRKLLQLLHTLPLAYACAAALHPACLHQPARTPPCLIRCAHVHCNRSTAHLAPVKGAISHVLLHRFYNV